MLCYAVYTMNFAMKRSFHQDVYQSNSARILAETKVETLEGEGGILNFCGIYGRTPPLRPKFSHL